MKKLLLSFLMMSITMTLISQETPYYLGLFHENEYITDNIPLESEDVTLSIWNGLTDVSEYETPFAGDTCLSYLYSGSWGGMGITMQETEAMDFSPYLAGYLHLALKMPADGPAESFRIAFKDQEANEFMIQFVPGEDPYDFQRNGEWHELLMPIADFRKRVDGAITETAPTSADLEDIRNPLMVLGNVHFSLDEIWWAEGNLAPGESPSGIKADRASERIFFYPNPVEDILYLDASVKIDQVAIFDLSGRRVFTETGFTNHSINVSELNPGVYFIKGNGNGNKFAAKFVRK